MKIIFIRPPVALWPNHPSIYPLTFLYLSAALIEKKIGEVKIIDCQAEKIGWAALEKILIRENPDIAGVSINSVTVLHEASRLARLIKKCNPKAFMIAGGVHASAVSRQILEDKSFDIVVRFEGEKSVCELINELDKEKPQLHNIKGIAFKENGKVILTDPYPLINDLDELPDLSLSYPLLKLEKYKGDIQYGDATIQASRGCAQKCLFCACWPHYAERSLPEESLSRIVPRLRFRSVQSVMKEIETLYYQYGKRHFFFIDDCFNTNWEWEEELANAIIAKKLEIKFTAFMRLDYIIRDYEKGVFDKLVRAGLSLVLSGIERGTNQDLEKFNKGLSISEIEHSYRILHKYPKLVKLAIAIVGAQNDTVFSIRELGNFIIRKLRPDFCSFQALTPLPGTLLWDKIKNSGQEKNFDFSRFHWSNAVMPTAHLSVKEVRSQITRLQIMQSLQLRRILSALIGPKYRRSFYRYIYYGSFKVAWQLFKHRRNILSGHYCDFMKPDWYES